MHAAAAQVGVAIVARLPNVTLSPTGGFSTFNLAQQFATGSGFDLLTGLLTHTAFDGNALLDRQKAAGLAGQPDLQASRV